MSFRRRLLTVVAVLLALAIVTSGVASPETAVAVAPSEVKDLETGASFTVDVTMTEVDSLYGWQFNVTFDPGVLSVEGVVEGPFLEDVYATAWVTPIMDNTKGFVVACSTLMPPYPPQGVSGDGVLANITFTVKSGGSSALHFDADNTFLRTVISGTVVPIENYAAHDGSFTGTGGGASFPQIPLEVIAGAVIAVVVVIVAVAFYLKRRRQ
jgi:hypothetical protein